jgi:hypothetical protein
VAAVEPGILPGGENRVQTKADIKMLRALQPFMSLPGGCKHALYVRQDA